MMPASRNLPIASGSDLVSKTSEDVESTSPVGSYAVLREEISRLKNEVDLLHARLKQQETAGDISLPPIGIISGGTSKHCQ